MNINKQAGQETPLYKEFCYSFNICHQMLALQYILLWEIVFKSCLDLTAVKVPCELWKGNLNPAADV